MVRAIGARRIALLTVAAGCLVVSGLVALNWRTVRDHGEAWWFVGTRPARTVSPGDDEGMLTKEARVYQQLSDRLECPVIFDPAQPPHLPCIIGPGRDREDSIALGEYALKSMREEGWRILEQSFPRRALVVVRRPFSSKEEALEYVKRRVAHQQKARAAVGG